MKKLLSLLLLSSLSMQLHCATFCAIDSAELKNALAVASTNEESDLIKIANGNYISLVSGFLYLGFSDFDIEISGGWTFFFGNPCGTQIANSPFNTVIAFKVKALILVHLNSHLKIIFSPMVLRS